MRCISQYVHCISRDSPQNVFVCIQAVVYGYFANCYEDVAWSQRSAADGSDNGGVLETGKGDTSTFLMDEGSDK